MASNLTVISLSNGQTQASKPEMVVESWRDLTVYWPQTSVPRPSRSRQPDTAIRMPLRFLFLPISWAPSKGRYPRHLLSYLMNRKGNCTSTIDPAGREPVECGWNSKTSPQVEVTLTGAARGPGPWTFIHVFFFLFGLAACLCKTHYHDSEPNQDKAIQVKRTVEPRKEENGLSLSWWMIRQRQWRANRPLTRVYLRRGYSFFFAYYLFGLAAAMVQRQGVDLRVLWQGGTL